MRPDCYTLVMAKLLSVPVEDQSISAQLFMPTFPNREGIIFIHGWHSNQESTQVLAQNLADEGFKSLNFDLRGMGKSDGDINVLTRENYLNDCMVIYDTLAGQPHINKVSVVGVSFGSYMACLLTKYRTFHRIAIRNPANYSDESFYQPHIMHSTKPEFSGYQYDINILDDTYAIKALKAFEGEVLIVESSSDEVIRHATVNKYRNAISDKSRLTYTIIQNSPHSISKNEKLVKAYSKILSEWFKRDI